VTALDLKKIEKIIDEISESGRSIAAEFLEKARRGAQGQRSSRSEVTVG
jgi:hypothetical protein